MKLLNTASVMERLDIKSKETVRQMVKNRIIPPPVAHGAGGHNKWLESDIDTYIESLAARRNGVQAQPQQAVA